MHHCDSVIADYIAQKLDYVLCNHDAFITNPNDIPKLREVYLEIITKMYKERHQILKEYYKSIGIKDIKDNYDISRGEIIKFSGYNLK